MSVLVLVSGVAAGPDGVSHEVVSLRSGTARLLGVMLRRVASALIPLGRSVVLMMACHVTTGVLYSDRRLGSLLVVHLVLHEDSLGLLLIDSCDLLHGVII